MNKKGKANMIVIVILIAAAVFFFFTYVGDGTTLLQGEITNGYWHEATQECRSAIDRPSGVPYIPGQIGVTMFQCCFNLENQQVDCNDASKLWGAGFSIYQGNPGFFSITHGITLTNTGNVDLTNAWIDSATWSPTNAQLLNAYATIIGSSYGSSLLKTQAVDLSTGLIDLQAIGGTPGSPITYDLSLVTKASATGLPDASQTTPASITVEQEAIGFSVQINLGA